MTGTRARDPFAALLARRDLARLLDVLDGAGEETRVVGGAVRNSLLGLPVTDVDLATTAPPPEVVRRASVAGLKTVPTGIEHGTVTVIVDKHPFEVTTLREDVETHGRHATVRFGRDFSHDAARRDFTMNALYLGRDGTLYDFTGGRADLAARRVRFIGDPVTRIREDYLRILRFFRFHAQYAAGPPDAAGLAATIAERDGLWRLSRERIRIEFLKLVAAPGAGATMVWLADAGFLAPITGGVGDHGRLARAMAADLSGASDALRRLGAFAAMVEEDAERLRERLRLSNAQGERLAGLARLFEALPGSGTLDERDLRRLVVRFGLDPLADALAIMDGEPSVTLAPAAAALLAAYREKREAPPVFPLTGAAFLARGVAAGPQVGMLLAHARDLWLDADCPQDPGALDDLVARVLATRVPATAGDAAPTSDSP